MANVILSMLVAAMGCTIVALARVVRDLLRRCHDVEDDVRKLEAKVEQVRLEVRVQIDRLEQLRQDSVL